MSRRAAFRRIAAALGPDGRRRLWLLALLTGLGAAAEYASLIALLALLRGWLADEGGPQPAAFLLFGGAVLAAGLIRFLLLAGSQRLAFETGHRLTVAVQRRLLARGWLAHVDARRSTPLAALQEVEIIVYDLFRPLLQAGIALVLGGAILGAMLWVDPLTALAAAALLGLLFVAALQMAKPVIARAGAALNHDYEERIAAIQEQNGAMRELLLGGTRGLAAERFRSIDAAFAKARTTLAIARGFPRLLVETLGLLALIGLAAWLASRTGGLQAALPTLAVLALGAQRLLPLANTLAQAVSGLTEARAPLERVAAILAEPDLAEGPPPSPLPFADSITLEQVSLTYPGRTRPALQAVDLRIGRGERVALIGPNGSGKSSLADIVMGLLEPSEGRLLVDGRALGPGQLEAWQRAIAHVPQSPFLADASIAANIAFMQPEVDQQRIERVAGQTGLAELIAALPKGFATRVGSGGIKLSGGQRQRLALARALYAPAPLLVLDEATSALDPASELHLRSALDALQADGVTILLIAHRPGLLEGCSQIVRLEAGRVVERR